jgi:hypothetical protein
MSVAGGTLIFEAVCVVAGLIFYREPTFVADRGRVEGRKWHVAVSALAMSTMRDVKVIAALLDAIDVGTLISSVRVGEAFNALKTQLPGCRGPTLNRLNVKQRDTLHELLRHAALCDSKYVHIQFAESAVAGVSYRDLVPAIPRDAEFAIVILLTYEYLRDDKAAETVTLIAELDFPDMSEEWLPVIGAANHVLPIIRERSKREEGRGYLLRSSDHPTDDVDDLLRPNPPVYGGDDDLLRPAD